MCNKEVHLLVVRIFNKNVHFLPLEMKKCDKKESAKKKIWLSFITLQFRVRTEIHARLHRRWLHA